MTTDVAVLEALTAGSGWRKWAEEIIKFETKWIVDFMVSFNSLGSSGRAKRGMP